MTTVKKSKFILLVVLLAIMALSVTGALKVNDKTVSAANEEYSTSKVEKGMVLAYSTIVYFIPSTIKGLPKEKTTEDIRSRITADEAESIKRWETSKYGQPEIVIVRKIPFAIFISIGTVIYTFARMLIK